MYFKHNKFASISAICFCSGAASRWSGGRETRPLCPATRSRHYLSPMIDIVTSETELLSLVEEAYTQEEGRQIVANRYAYFLHIGCSVFCS